MRILQKQRATYLEERRNINVIKILELQLQNLVAVDLKNSQNFCDGSSVAACSVFVLATQKMVKQN
jgi:hypothetical protein